MKTPNSLPWHWKANRIIPGFVGGGIVGLVLDRAFVYFTDIKTLTDFSGFDLGVIVFFVVFGILSAVTMKSSEERKFVSDEGLTGNDKFLIVLECLIISPVIAGPFIYFNYKSPYPRKAQESRKIIFAMLLVWAVLLGLRWWSASNDPNNSAFGGTAMPLSVPEGSELFVEWDVVPAEGDPDMYDVSLVFSGAIQKTMRISRYRYCRNEEMKIQKATIPAEVSTPWPILLTLSCVRDGQGEIVGLFQLDPTHLVPQVLVVDEAANYILDWFPSHNISIPEGARIVPRGPGSESSSA